MSPGRSGRRCRENGVDRCSRSVALFSRSRCAVGTWRTVIVRRNSSPSFSLSVRPRDSDGRTNGRTVEKIAWTVHSFKIVVLVGGAVVTGLAVSWSSVVDGYLLVLRLPVARRFLDELIGKALLSWSSLAWEVKVLVDGYAKVHRVTVAHHLTDVRWKDDRSVLVADWSTVWLLF